MFFEMVASMLQQFAIEHAARSDRLAGTTTETEVDVAHRGIAEREPSFLDGAHQVNPAAGRIVLVARFEICWTTAEAQPAMDAGQCFLFVEEPRQ